ncbi:50S ribosomal protein L11 methyltransferase [Enhygromyxa salina]|uniref:Ribosomal protein L11 methyltransferase n=1 Tax=Enhygromyxa salina TaxID=215803 RepID=A0A2S9YQS3_9BACT|nr:50S ribosomal protein L11 methyltransferase [Enhygromyxa salina]PRQ07412.1 Ribosomal protein L11 methyltransferase [Enhygromyxa salina]
MSEHDAWSTVRVAMPQISTDEVSLSSALEQLEGLAALLAIRDDVGGVETRDPTCIAEGPDFVRVERPELIVYTTPASRAAVELAAHELAVTLGLEVRVDAEDHHGDDWRDAWKRHYRSLYFRASARSLMVRPSWIPREPDDPTCELLLDPGRAFGTGLHESTRLCLQALVELAAERPRRVIDLGCGSGILGLAALQIWPELESLCLADHDQEAVDTARENAEVNGIPTDDPRLELRQLVLGSDAGERLEPAQLVFANIRPSVLTPAATEITRAVTPGGALILSGILEEEGDEVLAAYTQIGLQLRGRPREGDWCALVLERPRAGSASR